MAEGTEAERHCMACGCPRLPLSKVNWLTMGLLCSGVYVDVTDLKVFVTNRTMFTPQTLTRNPSSKLIYSRDTYPKVCYCSL